MQNSASDTLFRAVVMGGVLGILGWGALRYPFVPRYIIQRAINWYENNADAQVDGGQQISHGRPQALAIGFDALPLMPLHKTSNDMPDGGGAAPAGTYPTRPASYTTSLDADRVSGHVAPYDSQRKDIERRLAELGAVYSLLEMWNREQPRFRFHCKVALPGGGDVTRSFEATGPDPQQVMQDVLRAVEDWRGHAGFGERAAP